MDLILWFGGQDAADRCIPVQQVQGDFFGLPQADRNVLFPIRIGSIARSAQIVRVLFETGDLVMALSVGMDYARAHAGRRLASHRRGGNGFSIRTQNPPLDGCSGFLCGRLRPSRAANG